MSPLRVVDRPLFAETRLEGHSPSILLPGLTPYSPLPTKPTLIRFSPNEDFHKSEYTYCPALAPASGLEGRLALDLAYSINPRVIAGSIWFSRSSESYDGRPPLLPVRMSFPGALGFSFFNSAPRIPATRSRMPLSPSLPSSIFLFQIGSRLCVKLRLYSKLLSSECSGFPLGGTVPLICPHDSSR